MYEELVGKTWTSKLNRVLEGINIYLHFIDLYEVGVVILVEVMGGYFE